MSSCTRPRVDDRPDPAPSFGRRIAADVLDDSSPQLEGFRARGIEVLLLADQVDSFWVTSGLDFDGKPFKSVTQGMADLSLIPSLEGEAPSAEAPAEVAAFIDFVKSTLGDAVSDVRASDRLTADDLFAVMD